MTLNTVYEVKLEKGFGCCLVCINKYPGYQIGESLAVQPLDYYSQDPCTLSKDDIEQLEYLGAPTLSFQKPPTRGPDKWRKLHHFVKPRSFELPICIADFTQRARFTSDWNGINWEVIFNMDTDEKEKHRFCEVAHLPEWNIGNSKYVTTNFTMLWMHLKGDDIKNHYNTEVDYTSEQYLYRKVTNIRLYKDVPIEYRNKVWPRGCEPCNDVR